MVALPDEMLTEAVAQPRPELPAPENLPRSLFGFVWQATGRHQIVLLALSVIVFVLTTAPLEFQRRIVNDAVHGGSVSLIAWLALGYAGVAMLEGLIKLVLNVYRGWVGEDTVRRMRRMVNRRVGLGGHSPSEDGTGIAMVLSEVEPIGGFVGNSLSEPMLQGGVLLSVFGYIFYLNPLLALVSLAVFSPQMVFVPLMQRAINRRVKARIQILRDVGGGIINGFAAEGESHSLQHRRIDTVFTLNMGIYKLKYSMNFLMNLMHHTGIAAVLGIGGYLALKGEAEVGTVVAFVSGLVKLNDPWGDIVNWFREYTSNSVKYRLIADTLKALAH